MTDTNSDASVTDWSTIDRQLDDKNYAEAYAGLRVLADSGDARALVQMGWMTRNGLGRKKDETKAMRLYREAEQRGEIEGALRLGQCLAWRERWAEARPHYEYAASNGSLVAAYRLGVQPKFAALDGAETRDWLQVAADGKHVWAQAEIERRRLLVQGVCAKPAALLWTYPRLVIYAVWVLWRSGWSDLNDIPRLRR